MMRLKKNISFLLAAIIIIVQLTGVNVYAYDNNVKLSNEVQCEEIKSVSETNNEKKGGKINPEEISSDALPENNILNDIILEESKKINYSINESDATKRVLLVEDTLPWKTNSNETVLMSLGLDYDKVTTSTFITKDLSEYGVVIFANDQQFSAYSNYVSFKEYMELFAEAGGVIVFGACDGGWANGSMNTELPGDVKKLNHNARNNYIADNKHPIVNGELIDNVNLLDKDLRGNYTSHTYFVEDTLPAGSKIILRDSDYKMPTLLEYPLGNGRVIASGLTWEFNYYYGSETNSVNGPFSQKAMADMFLYAIRVSSIDVNDVSKLKEYYLSKNTHAIVVADKSSNEPIVGARVKIKDKEYITDDNGMVKCNENMGEVKVTISAKGYRKSELIYNLKLKDSRLFFLEEDKNDGLPYPTMVLESSRQYDLKNQKLYFSKNDGEMCKIKLLGEWADNQHGKFIIYQDGQNGVSAGKSITIDNASGEIYFSPGEVFNPNQPVKLKMVAGNGKTSIPIVIGIDISEADNIVQDENNLSGILNQNKFVLTENRSGSINDENVTSIFPGDFNLKVSSLPLNVVYKKNTSDGTYSIRVTLGLGKSNYVDDTSKWENFKKDFKTATKNVDDVDRLAGLMQAYDKQLGKGSFTVSKKFTPQLSGLGYYEEKYDANDKMISSEGGLILNAGAQSTYSQQYLLGPIPCYFDLTGKLSFTGTAKAINYDHNKDEWNYNGKIEFIPIFTVGGGVGVKGVATVGVEGEAKLTIQIKPTPKGVFTPTARLTMYLLFVFDYKHTIATKNYNLWSKSRSPEENYKDYLKNIEFNLMSRDYNKLTTKWNERTNYSLLSADGSEYYSLQDWILPSSIPQIEKINDKLVMVFQADSKESSNGNNVRLMYSVYDNETWSMPNEVWDTNTSDLFSELVNIDDELYLIWQKQKKEVSEKKAEEMIEEASSYSEICYAKWDDDTESFVDVQYITNNDSLDMMPRLGRYNGNLAAIWVNNDKSNPFGQEGSYTINVSEMKDGKWTAATEIYRTNELISELALDNNSNIAFVSSNASEGTDSEVYLINNKKTINLTDNDLEDTGIQFINNNLYWSCDGLLNEYNVTDNKTSSISAGGDTVINSSAKVVKSEDKTAIVWVSAGAETSKLMASILTEHGWSRSIELINVENNNIQSYDVKLSDTGNWKVVMNSMREVDGEFVSSLIYADIENKKDISLDYAIAAEHNRVQGIQPVDLMISNLGEETVDDLILKIYSENNIYFEKKLNVKLEPGNSEMISEMVDLSSLSSEKDIKILVTSENESSYENNEKTVRVGKIDVSLAVDRYEFDNKVVIRATVSNKSNIPANVAISVLDNDESGIVLDMKNIGKLTNDEDYVYIYSIDKNNVKFSEGNIKNYYIKIDTIEEDLFEDDNNSLISVYKNIEVEPSEEPIEDIEIINVTGVEINEENIKLVIDDESLKSHELVANIYPNNASVKQLKWTVEDSSVASVNRLGVVTAVSEGETFVTVETIDGSFVDKVKIKVIAIAEDDPEEEIPNSNYKVKFDVVSKWDGAFNGNITIENTGDTVINNWMIGFDFPHEITQIWDGNIVENERGKTIIKNSYYNQDIEPGKSVSFGFIAKWDNTIVEPSEYKILNTEKKVDDERVKIDFRVQNYWENGHIAEIEITNISDSVIEDWRLEFDFDSDIGSIWGAGFVSKEKNKYVIQNLDYNANIKPGETIRLGFNVNSGDLKVAPNNYKLIEVIKDY